MRNSVASAPDPFVMPETFQADLGFRDTNGKTLSSQFLDPTKRNCVLISVGQSNITNVAPTPYVPPHASQIDNLNPYDGAIYAAADALLGCSKNFTYGNPALRLAEKLIATNVFDRVIIVPIAINGTLVTHWDTGGVLQDRLPATIRRIASRGLSGTALIWGQGEGATEAGAYGAKLNSVIANSRAAGYTGPWFVAQQTWQAGVVNATIQAQQASVVNHAAGVWSGANADSMNAAFRVGDNTHFNDAGSDTYAELWRQAMTFYGPPFV